MILLLLPRIFLGLAIFIQIKTLIKLLSTSNNTSVFNYLKASYHPWSNVDIREQPLLLHSMGRKQGWGHLRANLGLGILVHPSPPELAYLQSISFIRRIFPSLKHGVGMTLVQIRVVNC